MTNMCTRYIFICCLVIKSCTGCTIVWCENVFCSSENNVPTHGFCVAFVKI